MITAEQKVAASKETQDLVRTALGIVKKHYIQQGMDDDLTLVTLSLALDIPTNDPALRQMLDWVKAHFDKIPTAQ